MFEKKFPEAKGIAHKIIPAAYVEMATVQISQGVSYALVAQF